MKVSSSGEEAMVAGYTVVGIFHGSADKECFKLWGLTCDEKENRRDFSIGRQQQGFVEEMKEREALVLLVNEGRKYGQY